MKEEVIKKELNIENIEEEMVNKKPVKEEKIGLIKRIASGSVFSGAMKDKIKPEKTTLRSENKPFFSGLKREQKIEEERLPSSLQESPMEESRLHPKSSCYEQLRVP